MTGKEKCEYLKLLRETIANQYGFQGFQDDPCNMEYCSTGFCEKCDHKKSDLLRLLKKLNVDLTELQDICKSIPIPYKDEYSKWLQTKDKTTEADWQNETKLNEYYEKLRRKPIRLNNSSINGYISNDDIHTLKQKELAKLKKKPKFICKLFTIGQLLGISRLRIDVDGPGVTTLVGLHNCPLNCAYCINHPNATCVHYTIKELYDEVKGDTLYYESTGGGICFGGHEPLLQQKFIKKFIKYTQKQGHKWKFGIETSLNSKLDDELLEMLDFIIVDVKTINPEIYQKYTKCDNVMVLKNLELIKNKIPNITIRLPHIENYNDQQDVVNSINYLIKLGYCAEQFDVFMYKTDVEKDW